MKENLVFVQDSKDLEDLIYKNNLKEKLLVICKNYEVKEKISKMQIDCNIISNYKLSKTQTTKSIEWIKSWPNEILIEGKNFKELFIFNQISLFWFLESRLYHKRIHELIIQIEQIREILRIENPKKVWVIDDNEINQIVINLHDNVNYVKKYNKIEKSNISEKSYSGLLLWKLILLKITRGLISRKIKFGEKNFILIITEIGSWRKTFEHFSKKHVEQDVFFHKIIQKLKERNQSIGVIDFENNPKRLLNSPSLNKKRNKIFEVPVIPWEKFLTFRMILKSYNVYNEFRKKWKKLKETEQFQESLNFEGIPLYQLVKKDFDELFNSFKAIGSIAMIMTADKIIKVEKPSKIIMHDEYGALQLSFLNASKKFKIPSLSLQHGTISQNVFAYSHDELDINNTKNELNFPLPNKMCVWSENAKIALLESGKFPSTIPIITGDPKIDFFSEIQKKYKREEILKKYNILSKKKIILFATENLPNLEEANLIANTVLESVKNIDNSFLIIKIHPNETNFLKYQKLAKKLNIKNFIILKDVDLYELIHVSDLVLVSYSTVGMEAMRMSKPVISLNLMGIHNESIIIKNKSAIEVRTKNELIPKILECFTNKNNEQIQNSKIFAEKEIGKTDNNATTLIVEEILRLKYTKIDNNQE